MMEICINLDVLLDWKFWTVLLPWIVISTYFDLWLLKRKHG